MQRLKGAAKIQLPPITFVLSKHLGSHIVEDTKKTTTNRKNAKKTKNRTMPIFTKIIANPGPTNAQIAPVSTDNQQLQKSK
jgi:hypothetical protein